MRNLITTSLMAAAVCAAAATGAGAATTLIYGEAGPNRGVRAEGTQWLVDEV